MVYFVTETWLKENTNIGDNVDAKKIVPLIRFAAESYTKDVIGIPFYKELLTKFNNQTLSNEEASFISDYLKPSIAWRAAADSAQSTSYGVFNKGVQKQSGDFSQSPEMREIMFVYKHANDKASFYDKMVIDFLSESSKTDFPTFWSNENRFAIARKSCKGGDTFNKNIIFI